MIGVVFIFVVVVVVFGVVVGIIVCAFGVFVVFAGRFRMFHRASATSVPSAERLEGKVVLNPLSYFT